MGLVQMDSDQNNLSTCMETARHVLTTIFPSFFLAIITHLVLKLPIPTYRVRQIIKPGVSESNTPATRKHHAFKNLLCWHFALLAVDLAQT